MRTHTDVVTLSQDAKPVPTIASSLTTRVENKRNLKKKKYEKKMIHKPTIEREKNNLEYNLTIILAAS